MKIPKPLALVSLALFVAACCMPAIAFSKPPGSGSVDTWSGVTVLLMGWLGTSLLLIPARGRIPALILCVLALALSLTALGFPGRIVDADERGVSQQQIEPLRAGAAVIRLFRTSRS
jgi:hypothetical protein